MEKMRLPIKVFTNLYRLRELCGVEDDREWSNLSGVPTTRISEFLKISKGGTVASRHFRLENALMLYGGISTKKGDKMTQRAWTDMIESEKDQLCRIGMLMVKIMSVAKDDETARDQLERALKSVEMKIESK